MSLRNDAIARTLTNEQAIARFWSLVNKTETCWLWTGYTNKKGYGTFSTGKYNVFAHRFSWALATGCVPSMDVLHNCPGGDNPACVNPAHLWLGTNTENVADMDAKGRHARLLGGRNAASKLTAEKVRDMRSRAVLGERSADLGQEHGVSESTARYAIQRRTWKHVD